MTRLSLAHIRRGLIPSALLVVACAKGPATPSAVPGVSTPTSKAVTESAQGSVSGSAAGDVKSGPIEILNVRVRPTGAPGFYAFAGGNYRVNPGTPVELWVEWKGDVALAEPPRLVIDWNVGADFERDNIHCGPCLLTHTYKEGLFTVRVLLDDRISGTTTRTFQFDTRPLPNAPPLPTIKLSATYLSGSIFHPTQTPLPPTLNAGGLLNAILFVTVNVTAKDGDGNTLPFVLESADCVNCELTSSMLFGFPNFTFQVGTPDVNWAVLRLTNPVAGPNRANVSFSVVYATTDSLGRTARATLGLTITP